MSKGTRAGCPPPPAGLPAAGTARLILLHPPPSRSDRGRWTYPQRAAEPLPGAAPGAFAPLPGACALQHRVFLQPLPRRVHVCACMCVRVCMCTCVLMCMRVCTCVCTCMCMRACVWNAHSHHITLRLRHRQWLPLFTSLTWRPSLLPDAHPQTCPHPRLQPRAALLHAGIPLQPAAPLVVGRSPGAPAFPSTQRHASPSPRLARRPCLPAWP